MRLTLALCVLVLIAGVNCSCKIIKTFNPMSQDGIYDIYLQNGKARVFCDMTTHGGGYTFIPRDLVTTLTNRDLQLLHTDKTNVLLRILRLDGSQPFTVISQYTNTGGVSVQVTKYAGYRRPVNFLLGPYLYLGTLPAGNSNNRNIQGFRANGQPVTFRNCDSNPNNYFAFFPNSPTHAISPYHNTNLVYERQGVAVTWRSKAKTNSAKRMPSDFFMLTEMHYGGCGCYTSSDRWNKASQPALGTSIGMR